MRWRLVVLIASLPLLAAQSAHTQEAPAPSCAVACSVNPFTAPASCDCSAPGGETSDEAPADVPPPATDPADSREQPAPVEPGVPSCQLACSVNPFIAPPECDCQNISISTGGGATPSGPGPAVTPAPILEDGSVTVGEILDFMENLYRQRIAGVQTYYFLERVIVGQTEPIGRGPSPSGVVQPVPLAASAPGREGRLPEASSAFRILPASFVRPVPAAQGPVQGVDTILSVLKFFEKVTRNGHPAMEHVLRAMDPAFAQTEEGQVAAAFMGLLAGLTGAAAEDGQEPEYQDVLEELLQLKATYDRASPGTERLYVGTYERADRRFVLGSRCAPNTSDAQLGCASDSIHRYIAAEAGAVSIDFGPFSEEESNERERIIDEWSQNHLVCIVWQVGESGLADLDLQVSDQPEDARPVSAELWFPIQWALQDFLGVSPNEIDQETYDRPVRMLVVYRSGQSAPYDTILLDRVYDDFRLVQAAGQIQQLFEPHTIMQRFGPIICPSEAAAAEEAGALGSDDFELYCVDEIRTGGWLPQFITESHRKDFSVNEPRPSTIEESQMLMAPW